MRGGGEGTGRCIVWGGFGEWGGGLFWSAALQFSEIICQSELGWRDRKREEERKNYVIGSVVAWVRLVG